MGSRVLARTFSLILAACAAHGVAVSATYAQVVASGIEADTAPKPESVLGRRAKLNVKHVPLAEALTKLSESSGVVLAFSPSLASATSRFVSCDCRDRTVAEALRSLLERTGLAYIEVKGQVMIYPMLPQAPEVRLERLRPVRAGAGIVAPVGHVTLKPETPVLQQDTVVAGIVVDAVTGQPLDGAQVIVDGTDLGTVTDSRGRFRIAGLQGGEARLRVVLLGYGTGTQVVRVGDSDIRFRLEQTAVGLDQIVVTGTPGGTQARAIGNTVTQVSVSDVLERRAPDSFQSLVSVEVPSLTLRSVGGEIGSGGSIKIRGTSSLALTNEPVIFVDGVRVDNRDGARSAAFKDGGRPSRLNDLNLRDIDRIEVIKGPAAATLYGTEASNGVIQIFTQRGAQGAPRFEVVLREGTTFLRDAADKYPLVWARDPATGQLLSANLIALERERGTPIFTTGHPRSVFASVSGGIQNVRYYFSSDVGRDEGIVDYKWQNRFSGRSNLSYTSEKFEAGVNMGFVRQKTHTGGREQPVTFQIIWGSPLKLSGASRGLSRNAHEDYATLDGAEEVDRFTGGIYVRHSPFEWLNHRLQVGGDFGNTRSFSLWPRTAEQPGPFGNQSLGQKEVVQDRTNFTTIAYNASVPLDLTPDVTLETSSGVQYYQKRTEITTATGREFPVPGLSTVSAAAQHLSGEDFIENKTFGVYVQEKIGWKNRLFLTGAIRGDDNSAFGESFDFVIYPKLSLAWVISEEPFWKFDWVDAIKLRAAWGRAGQQPDVFAASRLYTPATGPGGTPTLTPSNIGNPDLKPEIGEEVELGFDAGLLDQRLSLEFTYFDQRRKDAIVPRSVLPSLGFPGIQFVNIGEVSNKGFEIVAGAQLLRTADWGWELNASYAHTQNRIEDLGGITPPLVGHPWPGQRHVEGYPVAGLFMKKVVHAEFDANGDLVNVLCEGGDPITGGGPAIPCDDAGTAFWGQPEPGWNVGATSTLRYKNLSLSATADGQGDYVKCNGDIAWSHVFFRNTKAIVERSDPILAAYDQMGVVCQAGLVDSGFAKLRDLSLRYELPSALTNWMGAASASVTLNAQNMLTLWQATQSRFGAPVIDPEIHSNSDANGIGDNNAYAQDQWPQMQRLTLTLRATF